uniref:scarecrow-like protein 33 n=1 Tax=Erigeron canadensis TaxID=72917 RepID=UPI001CB93700|nr:scarecrow-like protein 33 [Erigeron canadensis]XP_043621584.1 scarecrow-like protein 33 [Erigeron canadensis]
MIMEDPRFHEYTNDYVNDFSLDDGNNVFPIFDQFSSYATRGYRFRDEPLDLSFLDVPSPVANHDSVRTMNSLPGMASQIDSAHEEYDNSVFKFLNHILVEENMEGKQSVYNNDPFALQATENSFYEALGSSNHREPLRPPPLILVPNVQTPEEIVCGSSSEYSTCGSNNSVDPRWVRSDSFDTNSSVTQANSLECLPFRSSTTSVVNDVNDTMDSINTHMLQHMFTDSESILQFKRGMEEASKFLPPSRPLIIDLDKYNLPSGSPPGVPVKVERVDTENSPNPLKGRKHFPLEDEYFEDERISKQPSAVNEDEEAELCKMFDQILLCTNAKGEPVPGFGDHLPSHNNIKHVYNGWNAPWTGNPSDNIDIRTLLIKCAQSIADDDHRIASEQLKKIRKHTSPSGNASERLAHIFALGLEARLSDTSSQLYTSQKATKIPAADKLKPFQAYLSACPFVKNEVYYANKMILEAAWTSSTLHIVDFGIAYGFQWPILIKHLADRPGGPPKLRITGIEFPQPGFRPAEMVEETGRRLAIYCERFNVPFEYNALATQNWEMIKLEDLKLHRNEFLVVNSQARFENLLDEVNGTTDSPRDGVLKLIRDMKPDFFVHSVVNGSYSSPFFVTRFKEALFHYSSLFDMLDTILDRTNEHRQNFEMEFYGRQVMNVIACEGPQRVERPETYKQWQVRTSRAGFKPRRVNRDIVSQLKCKVKVGYHRDFVLDEDGKWMLQGWKGRILYAVSCWVPT